MKHQSIYSKNKRKLSVLLIICLVCFHLPVSLAYGAPDPKPEEGYIYVNGIDLLNSDEEDYPEGISYSYVDSVNVITVSGAAITLGYQDGGKYSGIYANEAGDVELVLVGNSSISISNETEPEILGDRVGIFTGGGSLTFSGTGSLSINSGGRSMHLDAYSNPGKAITFKDDVTVTANNSIFTEGEGESRPLVYINDSANITSRGIECGNDNTPYVDEDASFTNTDDGGGGPGGGGDPGPGTESLYINGVDILSEDYEDEIVGLTYDFDAETDTHIITLDGVSITSGNISPGNQMGIHAPSVGNVEIILVGSNSIIIPNSEDLEADPPMINGVGILVSQGNLTISGTGTLDIDVGDRAIILDAHGATETLNITFKDSVTVTANKSIFTEGDGESRPNVYINDTANITSRGIECGNDNAPIVAAGASFTNTDDGGVDPGSDEPFNLYVGGEHIVIDGEVQDVDIPNLEIIYYEHVDRYSLYLNGGTFGGIYTEGNGAFGIYAEESSTVDKLIREDYEDYSIVLSDGAEITPYDFLKERDPSIINNWDNTLTLTGGILSKNHLTFKDSITVNIGSSVLRANKGIVGDESLRVEAVNTYSINIWAQEVGIENVNAENGFMLGSSVDININSNGIGANDSRFEVGEGSTLNMLYIDKGNFVPTIYKWDYMDMTGPVETYANKPYAVVEALLPGLNTENKYSLTETATSYQLISTAKPLYTIGYNYDNDRDGVVDNPEEEIINGELSIKGATGICGMDSEGFTDYRFEAGTEVIIELLPDYGYQYEAGTLRENITSPIDTTPGETRAYYTFVMPDGHVHLYAGFIASEDIIQNNAPLITDADVDIGQNTIHGNIAFGIDIDNPTTEEIQAISNKAGNNIVGAYLDLSLSEYIAKAGTIEAWETELNELNQPVTINMSLSANLQGKSDYSVVRIHNGTATVIETTYSNGVISFETDSFSTYAIIYKDSTSTPTYPSAPTTGTGSPAVTPTITPSVTPTPRRQYNITITKENEGTGGAGESEGAKDTNMTLSSEIIRQAIETGEKATVTIRNKEEKELYSWTFDTDKVLDKDKKMDDVNLTIDVLPLTGDKNINEELSNNPGLILSFGHEGDLPAPATVKIYVGDMDGIVPGMQIYLYHYNKATGKLNTLPYSSSYIVDENGYISVNIVHCSDYIVLKDEAKANQITSLRNQIEVSVLSNKLYVGGTRENKTDLLLRIPKTLEIVKDIKEATSSESIGGITVSYSSSDEKVVTVDNNGAITAVGVGEAVISTKLTLYSGKIKIVKIMITVEEAYVDIKVAKAIMNVDDSYTFRAKAYGLYSKDIIWSTDDETIIAIDESTGKAIAKSKGTCRIIANIGGVIQKVKVIVK